MEVDAPVPDPRPWQMVLEPIAPEAGSFDARAMSTGAPGVPRRFLWEGRSREVREVQRVWKTTGPCSHGSGETYVRRHYYEVATTDGDLLRLYADRSVRRGGKRWWLHSILRGEAPQA